MNREQAITLLRLHELEFRRAGIGALFLFGSVARDEALATSDVDVFFDLDRPHGFTLFNLVEIQERMQDILGTRVDLMSRQVAALLPAQGRRRRGTLILNGHAGGGVDLTMIASFPCPYINARDEFA
jgi:predicted nucleotidyltransferase